MTGLSRADLKLLTGLARRKVREKEGLFLAEGVRVVEELLSAGLPIRLAVTSPDLEETDRGRALAAALGTRGVAVREVGRGRMHELADTRTTQGVLVVAEAPRARLESLPPADGALLVLDGVQDPGNLGTLARSAAAFGCRGLLCLPGTVDPWNPKAVRASAGALFRLPVLLADDAARALGWLAEGGYRLLGADAAGEPVESTPLPPRVALAVGNEGAGLTASVASACEGFVAVPMPGGTESLNVAVATSILLYVITRGRK